MNEITKSPYGLGELFQLASEHRLAVQIQYMSAGGMGGEMDCVVSAYSTAHQHLHNAYGPEPLADVLYTAMKPFLGEDHG